MNPEIEAECRNIRAIQVGMMHAAQVAIRAICAAHPNPIGLAVAFKQEHQESMALMLAKPIPEATLEAYKECLWGMAPCAEEWLES